MSGRQLTPSEQVMIVRGLGRIGERAKADLFMAGYFFFVDDDDEASWLRSLMEKGQAWTETETAIGSRAVRFGDSVYDPRRLRCDKCADTSVLFGPVGVGEQHDGCGGTYQLVDTRAEL